MEVAPVLSVHFDFIDHMGHPLDPDDGLLGDLFLVEAGQATSQEKGAVVVPTQYPSYTVVLALEEAIRRSLLNSFEKDGGFVRCQTPIGITSLNKRIFRATSQDLAIHLSRPESA